MSIIEDLLMRRQEGTITDEELTKLNQLTHRDQVLQAAAHRAKVLRHRKYAGISGVASVLVVAVMLFAIHPNNSGSYTDGPMMAQAEVPSVRAEQPEIIDPQLAAPTAVVPTKAEDVLCSKIQEKDVAANPTIQASLLTSAPESNSTTQCYESVSEEVPPAVSCTGETVVACNTQCSPDSVINDIWKFLRT